MMRRQTDKRQVYGFFFKCRSCNVKVAKTADNEHKRVYCPKCRQLMAWSLPMGGGRLRSRTIERLESMGVIKRID